MLRIMPITELRKTDEVSELCHRNYEPIFITKNGYSDLVVMSIESYELLVQDNRIDAAIMEAEAELESGAELADAREAIAGFKRKYGR